MRRRTVLAIGVPAALAMVRGAWAHHGWSGFDQQRPLYLEGKAAKVAWRNPHAELTLERAGDLRLPADLAQRALPAQSAPVEGPALLAAARLPTRTDKLWTVELAPLTRLEAWKMAPIAVGTPLAVLGFAAPGEKGEPVLRAEYVWVAGQVYGLRSSPA
ncbi:DUF6152 family protein [Aquincola sp. MAHUQ-54]|uniref:DUF6152 family protein n=1 Tax=Aquincola agrisoli TaxID=3119538 RepID=A0AAW9QBN3_9BURK